MDNSRLGESDSLRAELNRMDVLGYYFSFLDYARLKTKQLPKLEPLICLKDGEMDMAGPNPESNWLVKNKLLCGSQPTADSRYPELQKLKDTGITHFINLGGKQTKSYVKLMEEIDFAHGVVIDHPIEEFDTNDKASIEAIHSIVTLLKQNDSNMVYLHCRAGHGRTGMVAAVALAALYPKISPDQAMKFVQRFHDQREDSWGNWRSPETKEQYESAVQMIINLREGKYGDPVKW